MVKKCGRIDLRLKSIISIIFVLPCLLLGEILHSQKGYLNLGTIHRLKDGSIIKIPYRMATYESIQSYKNINLNFSAALEFRLNDINDILNSKFSYDTRELYFEYFLPFGDLSIGKQIITWGSASENNPTDNISPYNYYYLFSIGKEKKEGLLSLSTNLYWDDIKINTVFIPNHKANILPLNDPEFAISSPIIPKNEQILSLNKNNEYGLAISYPFNSTELTLSYFSGYDRIVSFFGANVWANKAFDISSIIPDTILSFRKTNVIGCGFSTFIGDFTLKSDFGYFNTYHNIEDTLQLSSRKYESGIEFIIKDCEEKNADLPIWADKKNCINEPILKETLILDNTAEYYQYTFEVEYNPNLDLNIIGQYSRYKAFKFGKADSLTLSEPILLYPKDLFIPGIGAPNTLISNNALSFIILKNFPDIDLEIRSTNLLDLDKKGALFELGIEYKIYNNTKILVAINKIVANKKIDENPFIGMEDFSHLRAEIKYFY